MIQQVLLRLKENLRTGRHLTKTNSYVNGMAEYQQ